MKFHKVHEFNQIGENSRVQKIENEIAFVGSKYSIKQQSNCQVMQFKQKKKQIFEQ